MTVEEVAKELLSNPLTDGLTLSGGEPFDQAEDCLRLAKIARENGLNVWSYSGYTFEHLLERGTDAQKALLAELDVCIKETSINEAKAEGAMALFGEKYGDVVRMVKMGDYSIELCGGCHVKNTANIGLFKIVSESSVAAGVRRIEAVTGTGFLQYALEREAVIEKCAKLLHTKPAEIAEKTEALLGEIKALQKELDKLRQSMASGIVDELIDSAEEINGVKVITALLAGVGVDEMRSTGDKLRDKLGTALVVLASDNDGKVNFVAMASQDAVKKGVHCGNIVREAAKIAGGGGGGKPDSAAAGGKDASKIPEAFESVKGFVEANVK